MPIRTAQITVTTSATALTAVDVGDYIEGNSLALRNTGATDAYVGDSTVTSSTGFLLKAGESMALDAGNDAVPYGVVASGSTTVAVLGVK